MHHVTLGRRSVAFLLAGGMALCPNGIRAAEKDWETMENCQLIPNKDNDGDSFHIRAGDGTEYLVRLYMVDAPETRNGMATRLDEQATYFGIEVPQVVEIGRKAKQFVDSELAEPFTVFTKRASGLGRSNIERFYGFVQTKDGDLGELLVRYGLARVHGTHAAPPGVSSSDEELQKLQQFEQQAKQKKLGAWSQSSGGTSSPSQPARAIALPSPSRTASEPSVVVGASKPSPPVTRIAPPKPTATSVNSDKLDVNTATKEQLKKIPGIGDALSERIIAARPFTSADDLKRVKGIGGGKRYEEVRPYFK